MGLQDFTAFTKVDVGGHLTVNSATKITGDDVPRNADAYTYIDKGAAFFPADFEIRFKAHYVASNNNFSYCQVCTVANLIDDFQGIDTSGGDELTLGILQSTGYFWRLNEVDGGTVYSDNGGISLATDYWVRLVRDSGVGADGTLYAYVYTDEYSTLDETLSVALQDSLSYRYLYAVQSVNSGGSQSLDLTVENMEVIVPSEGTGMMLLNPANMRANRQRLSAGIQ